MIVYGTEHRMTSDTTCNLSRGVRVHATPVRDTRSLVGSGRLPRAVGRVKRQLMLQPRHVWMATHRDLQITYNSGVQIVDGDEP